MNLYLLSFDSKKYLLRSKQISERIWTETVSVHSIDIYVTVYPSFSSTLKIETNILKLVNLISDYFPFFEKKTGRRFCSFRSILTS